MLESAIIAKAKKMLEESGCIVVKTHGNAYFPVGFPDLIIIRPDGVTAFVEAKSGDNVPSPVQEIWIEALRKKGCHAGWSNWPEGICEIALTGFHINNTI